MARHIVVWSAVIILLAASLGLGYLAYRRIGAPPQLLQSSITVDGVITEKLIEQQRLSPLPIAVPAYVVRYSFPTAFGQMRTGQQTVTQRKYQQLGDQGAPVRVIISPNDAGISAVDARITFPAGAGIRLMASIGSLLAAYLIIVFGIMRCSRKLRAT